MLQSKLAEARLPGALEALRLTLGGLSEEMAQQESFFLEVRRREPASGGREAVRQPKVHLGGQAALYRIRMGEPWSRIPERLMALVECVP